MSGSLIRDRFSAVAVKIETTPGTDAIGSTPAAGDWFGGTCEVQWDQSVTPNNEFTGSLDSAPGIVGGLRARVTLTTPLRGSGAPGTAPDFGRLLRCGTMQETITPTAIGAPTAATDGTEIGATLATPFAATAQLYRGMPMLLSGAHTSVDGVVDYTAERVASFGRTFDPALGVSDSFQIPVNVLYGPTSDEAVYKTATIYLYKDGLRWRLTGFVGTPTITLTTGGTGVVSVQGMAQLAADPDVVALPAAALGIVRPTPPRFVNGLCQLNRMTAQVRTLTFNLGVGTVLPDNPEALEGYDPAVPISRDTTVTLDPYTNVTSYVPLFNAFRQGTSMPLQAIIGTVPGNRFVLTVPAARATQNNPGNRDGLATNQITADADGADSGLFIAAF
ncbi:hypothetical protein [Roseomonas chloroacetimidivorans]|uniref:hypothetical protein n=1 Tax=Roseomonas chloroacetimidivorans TaxID=1766656 RepID=UPI003C711660